MQAQKQAFLVVIAKEWHRGGRRGVIDPRGHLGQHHFGDERQVERPHLVEGEADLSRPADEIDVRYGQLLREAIEKGVEVLAWKVALSAEGFELEKPLPIAL